MRTSGRIGVMAVLTVLLTSVAGPAPGARDQSEKAASGPDGPQEADVVAVALDPRTQAPAIVLQGKRDKRNLVMSIDPTQMMAIAIPLNGVTPPRPLTHDLFLTLFGRLKVTLTRVVITDMRDDIFYATVHLTGSGGEMVLDSRPSDAIALAIRAKVPVLVEGRVFDKGGAPVAPRRPSI
jgi:hypothetical protein